MSNTIPFVNYEEQVINVTERLLTCIQKELTYLQSGELERALELLPEKKALSESYKTFYQDLFDNQKYKGLSQVGRKKIHVLHQDLSDLLHASEIVFHSVERTQKKMLDHLTHAIQSLQRCLYEKKGGLKPVTLTSLSFNEQF